MSAFGGLDLCACKRGFFTLRDCANPPIDELHELHAADLRRAHDRAGHLRRVRGQARRGRGAGRRTLDPRYAVRYRHRWYRSSGYEPVYWGTYDPYWSDTDYRWYDEPDDDDDDGGGFGDS